MLKRLYRCKNLFTDAKYMCPLFDPISFVHGLCTWMSSSLVSNSDASTFCPSDTLVRDTQSLPVARM